MSKGASAESCSQRGGRSAQVNVVGSSPRQEVGRKQPAETELQATPSASLPDAMVASPVQIENVEESPA